MNNHHYIWISFFVLSLFNLSCAKEAFTDTGDENFDSDIVNLEDRASVNISSSTCYDPATKPYEGGCDIANKRYEKLIKISNSGRALPDTAFLGSGPDDWACTFARYKDLNNEVQYALWEVKTKDNSFRDMRWNYSWYFKEAPGAKANGQSGHCKKTDGQLANDCSTSQYIGDVNRVSLCGLKQWRLPNLSELSSILNCANNRSSGSVVNPNVPSWLDGYECSVVKAGVVNIDSKFFPNTAFAEYTPYWTIDVYPILNNEVYFVDFSTGAKNRYWMSEPKGVRLVHSLTAEQAATIQNDSVSPPGLFDLKILTNSITKVTWGDELTLIANTNSTELRWWYIDPSQTYRHLTCNSGLPADTCTFKILEQTPGGNYQVFAAVDNDRVVSNKIPVNIEVPPPVKPPTPAPTPAPAPTPTPAPAPAPAPPTPAPTNPPVSNPPQQLVILQNGSQILINSQHDQIQNLIWNGQYSVPLVGNFACTIKPKDLNSATIAEIKNACSTNSPITIQVTGNLKEQSRGQSKVIISNKITIK